MYVVVFQYLSIIWTGTEIQLHMLYAIATAYDWYDSAGHSQNLCGCPKAKQPKILVAQHGH